jgi:hypothetical protein
MALGLVSDEIRRVLTVGEMPKARRAAAGT